MEKEINLIRTAKKKIANDVKNHITNKHIKKYKN